MSFILIITIKTPIRNKDLFSDKNVFRIWRKVENNEKDLVVFSHVLGD